MSRGYSRSDGNMARGHGRKDMYQDRDTYQFYQESDRQFNSSRGGRMSEDDLKRRAETRRNKRVDVWVWSRSLTPPPRGEKGKKKADTKKKKEKKEDDPKKKESESEHELDGEFKRPKSKKRKAPSPEADENTSPNKRPSKKKRPTKKRKKRKVESSDSESSSSSSDSDSSSSSSDSSDSEAERKRRKKKSKKKKAKPSKKKGMEIAMDAPGPTLPTKKASQSDNEDDEEEVWEEVEDLVPAQELAPKPAEEDDDFGPQILNAKVASLREKDYGEALQKGEALAIASYVQKGMRIPRRGEVGLTSEDIKRHEDIGFVMSGSRHKRMNAIRIRKENQIYSAEEKRALNLLNMEERANKEVRVISKLQNMLRNKKLGPEMPQPQ